MTPHKDPYGRTMFVEIVVPKDEIKIPRDSPAARGGFLGSFWTNKEGRGNPVVQRREPAIWLHSHWELDPLPHPFLAEWTTWLETDQTGVYNFLIATSGPAVVSLDKEKVFETELDTSDPQRFSVAATAGRHLLAVSYWENSYRATITLAWQPPGKEPEVIPLNVITPLTVQEYTAIRGTLPRPRF
jgi:hypothetical protein